eukprot:2478121-Rhodomonas_salina.1
MSTPREPSDAGSHTCLDTAVCCNDVRVRVVRAEEASFRAPPVSLSSVMHRPRVGFGAARSESREATDNLTTPGFTTGTPDFQIASHGYQ